MHKILVAALAVIVIALAGFTQAASKTKPLSATQASRKSAGAVPLRLLLPNIPRQLATLKSAPRERVQRQLASSKTKLAFWKTHSWVLAKRHKKCWEVPWQRSCTLARANLRLHTELARTAQKRLWKELPLTNDWQTAVRIAQRVYPGTASWMLSISDREGGWGRWVWWSGVCGDPPCLWRGYHVGSDATGDTVGGWMQFRFSTFAPYWRGAVKDLRTRGFVIPEFPNRGGPEMYQAWLDPLGQALTAGYMRYYGKDGCHWCL